MSEPSPPPTVWAPTAAVAACTRAGSASGRSPAAWTGSPGCAGRTLGVLDLGPGPTLSYTGANGPTVTIALLASYLFSITSNVVIGSLSPRGHWASAAALAMAVAVVATGIARYGTHAIGSHSPTVVLLLALAALGASSAPWLCLRASWAFGSLIGTVVLVILGSASGGVVPAPLLPRWLAALRPALPMGAALSEHPPGRVPADDEAVRPPSRNASARPAQPRSAPRPWSAIRMKHARTRRASSAVR